IARACGLHEPAVRVWCEAARSLGLIEGGGDGYRLPADRRALLANPDDVRFLGGQFSYLALRSLDFGAFDAFFRRGEAGAPARRSGSRRGGTRAEAAVSDSSSGAAGHRCGILARTTSRISARSCMG